MRVLIFVVLLGLGGCIQFGRAEADDATGDSSADAAAVVMLPWLCEDGSGPSECCSNFDCAVNGKGDDPRVDCVNGACTNGCFGVECCASRGFISAEGQCPTAEPYCNHNACEATCQPECGDRECGSGPSCGGPNECGECAPGLTCASGQCKSLPK